MREIISEIIGQSRELFDRVRVTGSSTETVVKAADKDKVVFLVAKLKEPLECFQGDFAMGNLHFLDGLLNFPNYKTDTATLEVDRQPKIYVDKETEEKITTETVVGLVFKDAHGKGAVYRTADAKFAGEQVNEVKVVWDVTFKPSKSKITELTQLSKLFSEVSKTFSIYVDDNSDLVFCLGDDSSSTHNAEMIFESGVTGTLNDGDTKIELTFDSGRFLSLTKLAGVHPVTLNISKKGVLSFTITTGFATYNYYLRAQRK